MITPLFGETGSANATVARLHSALAKPQGDGKAVPPLRLFGYCNTWNSKPCGEQCRWQTTDPTFADMSAPPSSRMRRALEYARTCIWNGCDTIEALKIIDEALRAGDNHASDTTKIKIPLPEWLGPDTPENRERLQAFVEGRNNEIW